MKKLIIFITSILVVIDQIIKYFISNSLDLNESIKIISNFFNITYVRNDGAAFSIFPGGRWYFIIIGIIALVFLIRFIYLDKKILKLDLVSYSLVLSGILGNLIDRLIYGSVIDYMHFKIFNYDFAIFNFADMCIVIGVFLIIFILIVKGDNDENIYSRK